MTPCHFCPFVKDCPDCEWRGGTAEPQEDSPVSGKMGARRTAPAGNRGLARSSGTSREGMASMIATFKPVATLNPEIGSVR